MSIMEFDAVALWGIVLQLHKYTAIYMPATQTLGLIQYSWQPNRDKELPRRNKLVNRKMPKLNWGQYSTDYLPWSFSCTSVYRALKWGQDPLLPEVFTQNKKHAECCRGAILATVLTISLRNLT